MIVDGWTDRIESHQMVDGTEETHKTSLVRQFRSAGAQRAGGLAGGQRAGGQADGGQGRDTQLLLRW